MASKGRIHWAASALALALAGAVTMSVVPGTEITGQPEERPAPSVRVERVQQGESTRDVRLSGVVRSRRRGSLAFETGGRLVARTINVGDRFAAGQVLARLDARQLENAVSVASAALAEIDTRLAQVDRERERTVRLLEAGAATREEAEQSDAGVEALRASRDAALARLVEARRGLGETVLRAPFAGTVVSVGLEPGEYVQPGQAVLEVSGDGEAEVEIEVPEPLLRHLVPDREVAVQLPLSERSLAGRIRSVGDAPAGRGRLFPVVVALGTDPGVRAGMTAVVVLEAVDANAWLVPLAAVFNPGGGRPSVMRLLDGRTERVPVEIGSLSGDRVTVRGPLATGDLVVVSGQASLAHGDRAEVR